MMSEIELRIHLDQSVPGTRGGIQVGSGSSGCVPSWVAMTGAPVTFIAMVDVKDGALRGKSVQKDSKGKFVYLVWRDDAGIVNRRAKIYLNSISEEMLASGGPIEISLPGRAKDGYPCCATVRPLVDWRPAESDLP